MRKTKLIIAYMKRLVVLLDEADDIFYEERPFLMGKNELVIIPLTERRYHNELQIKKTIEAIGKEMGKDFSEEASISKQETIFGMGD